MNEISNKSVDRHPGRAWLIFLYTTRCGAVILFFINKYWFSALIGWYKKSFLSRHEVGPFIKKHHLPMTDFVIPVGGYRSFNDFFIRSLRQGARPIASDSQTIISPADGYLSVFTGAQCAALAIKGKKFSLNRLFNNTSCKIDDPLVLVLRLAPYHYHRFHLPLDGVVGAPREISGLYDSVHPIVYASGRQPLITNQRVIIPVSACNGKFPYYLIPVGALGVGKIVCSYTSNSWYVRGKELGLFEFGGSTIVLVVSEKLFALAPNFVAAYQTEQPVLMGQALGQLRV